MENRPPLRIEIKPLEAVLEETAQVMKDAMAGKHVEPTRTLSFDTIDDFRSFFTEKRLELLKAIRHHEPQSIYELAKIVQRDLKSVRTDLKKLIHYGVVTTKRKKANVPAGYKRVPQVEFDRMVLEIAV